MNEHTVRKRIDPEFEQLMSWGVDALTRYATTIRYGEDFYTPNLDEAREAIERAKRVRAFVRNKLKSRGFSTHE